MPTSSRAALPSGPWVGFAGVVLLFSLLIGSQGGLGTFWSIGNLEVLFHEGTIPAIVGLGMLLVLISGGIDLSVGAVVALVTVVTMKVYSGLFEQWGPSPLASLLAVASGVATGGVCGLANGLLITKLKLPPFVATLGMFGIARGVAIWLADRTRWRSRRAARRLGSKASPRRPSPIPASGRSYFWALSQPYCFAKPCWAVTFMPSVRTRRRLAFAA